MHELPAISAAITAIEYALPERVLTNAELAATHPDWQLDKIAAKTGIRQRHIAAPSECASDLAVAAGNELFRSGAISPAGIDTLVVCTQSPDYVLPTTACIVQDRLGIPTSAAAFDVNLGCSGYVYGLGIAKGLVESGQSATVLLITVDTYSKYLADDDRSVRPLFGDGAAATLVRACPRKAAGPFLARPVWGTDGSGAKNLFLKAGAAKSAAAAVSGCAASAVEAPRLYMNGPEIFNFTLRVVPGMVERLLQEDGTGIEGIDLFVFHQANEYLLRHLRDKIGIPEERFYMSLADVGNTVSSTIPIALKRAACEGVLQPGHKVLLAGFGVGYSWGGLIVRWHESFS